MNKSQIYGLIALITISTSTFSSGLITFNGEIVAGTCTATIGTNETPGDGTITLPKVHTSVFSAAATTAGKTGFQIKLTGDGCTSVSGSSTITATPYFSYETNKVNNNGRVINTNTTSGGSVDIQILNHASSPINLTMMPSDQLLSENSNLTYQYYAEYYATASTVAAGPVTGSLTYNILYK